MTIQKMICAETGKSFFQVTGNGPKRPIVVEDELRHRALQAWASMFRAQV